jgi:hypothetical protein
VRGDEPQLAKALRIEERELEDARKLVYLYAKTYWET